MKNLSIGVHTHITNPSSSGYVNYLACIESWAKVADRVIVVDGGSTDNSLNLLQSWLGKHVQNVQVVIKEQAHWGAGDKWCWPQIAINRQTGLEHLDTDWAIHVDADHLAPDISRDDFIQILQQNSTKLLLSMPVYYYDNGIFHDHRARDWVLNLRRVKDEKLNIGYGIDISSKTHLDYPLEIKSSRKYIDPDIGIEKSYYIGNFIKSEGIITQVKSFAAGHLMFSKEQCFDKCMRLGRAVNRFVGAKFPITGYEIKYHLRYHRISGFETKEKLLQKNQFPIELRKIIDTYYRVGMVGSLLYRNCNCSEEVFKSSICRILRMFRRISTI